MSDKPQFESPAYPQPPPEQPPPSDPIIPPIKAVTSYLRMDV